MAIPLPQTTPLAFVNWALPLMEILACEVYETPAGIGAGGISDVEFERSERDEAKRTATIDATIMVLRSFGPLCPLDSDAPRSISDITIPQASEE